MYLVIVMSQTILTKAIGPYLNPEYQSPKYTAHSEGDIKGSFTTSGDIYLNITGNEVSLGVPVKCLVLESTNTVWSYQIFVY